MRRLAAAYVVTLAALGWAAGPGYSAGAIGLGVLVGAPLWWLHHRETRQPSNVIYPTFGTSATVVQLPKRPVA